MKAEVFSQIRDCIKRAYQDGSGRGDEFKSIQHALVYEFVCSGLEDEQILEYLMDWYARCEKALPDLEQEKRFQKYITWFRKKDIKLTCKALKKYCIGKEDCSWYQKDLQRRIEEIRVLPFDMDELELFLKDRFKDGARMSMVARALREKQVSDITGKTILMGTRKISQIIKNKFSASIHPRQVLRDIRNLEEEGVIKQTVKGKSGPNSKEANGYIFLPWKAPERWVKPNIKKYCLENYSSKTHENP